MTHFPYKPSNLPAGLMLIHGNKAESLRSLLVSWMKNHPLSPLETEVVLVQSNGIGQWLRLALAANNNNDNNDNNNGVGIAAALGLSLPSSFFWRVYRAVLGAENVPEISPFDKARLIWRLMRLLPDVLHEDIYAPLQQFLREDADMRKRYQLAERLADLFDQYQVYRADWLEAWAAGRDVLLDLHGNASPLAAEQAWQPALWRRLLIDVRQKHAEEPVDLAQNSMADAGRAAVHAAFIAKAELLKDQPRPAGLPRRVLVFGISSLSSQSLEVLARLAQWSQVLMCVQNPCEHYWADIVSGQELLRQREARQARKPGQPTLLSEESMHLHAHPLLAAWGKQGRDFIALLDEHDSASERSQYQTLLQHIGRRIDLFEPTGEQYLLQHIQGDILQLRAMAEICAAPRLIDPATDLSVRFHIAHSRQREIEILHDQLLAAFAADSSLRPRDVIVMLPDVDAYIPHIQAVFGLLDSNDKRYIPYSMADQGQRHFDPLPHAIERLLSLPQSRVGVSDVLDLLEVPALRKRFGLLEEDLPLLHRWVRGANIRWGLQGNHRASLKLPAGIEAAQNTWLFGLRRMLLGYATGQTGGAWQDIEPYDEIAGLDAARLGPLVELLNTLEHLWQELRTPATVTLWCERLRRLKTNFFDAESTTDAYTLAQLDQSLESWLEACDDAQLTAELPLSVVAEYWLASLDAGSLNQRFFAGSVTFATLMPMRAIPFRHVCLLGMNDGDYPRTRKPLDFDLMGRNYRPGDRSRREDDRYLFLEAMLAARDRLYISWVGRSITDNSERPPSVLVGQLRDHLAQGWQASDGKPLLSALTVSHPLQAFSTAYFSDQSTQNRTLFTYAHEWQRTNNSSSAPVTQDSLPPLHREEPLTLRDLIDFMKDPVKAFFKQRLHVVFEANDPASEDVEPFVLDGLQRWQLQNELIQVQVEALSRNEDRLAAQTAAVAAINRRGELAAGAFGDFTMQEMLAPMDELFTAYSKALARWPEPVASEIAFNFTMQHENNHLEVADWLGGIRFNSQAENAADKYGCVVLEASNLVNSSNQYRGDKVIRHWVRHLACQIALGPMVTEIISKKGQVNLPAYCAEDAIKHFKEIISAWYDGMRCPLPLAIKSAFAWLRALPNETGVILLDVERGNDAARKVYEPSTQSQGELGENPYLRRAWPRFDCLIESGEFARLSERLLRPIHNAISKKYTKVNDHE